MFDINALDFLRRPAKGLGQPRRCQAHRGSLKTWDSGAPGAVACPRHPRDPRLHQALERHEAQCVSRCSSVTIIYVRRRLGTAFEERPGSPALKELIDEGAGRRLLFLPFCHGFPLSGSLAHGHLHGNLHSPSRISDVCTRATLRAVPFRTVSRSGALLYSLRTRHSAVDYLPFGLESHLGAESTAP